MRQDLRQDTVEMAGIAQARQIIGDRVYLPVEGAFAITIEA
jgi:hypothetical protein